MDKPRCISCGKGATLMCPCTAAPYCCAECRRASWPEHKAKCTERLTRLLGEHRADLGRDHEAVGDETYDLGRLFQDQNRLDHAAKWLLEALRIYRVVHGSEYNARVRDCLLHLGEIYQRQGKLEEAFKMHKRHMNVARQIDGLESESVAVALNNVAACLDAKSLFDRAMEKYEASHEMFRSLLGEEDMDHQSVAVVLVNMSGVLRKQGRYAEAVEMGSNALGMQRRIHGSGHRLVAISLLNLGDSYSQQGRWIEALELLKEGLGIVRGIYPDGHSLEGRFLDNIGIVYCDQGKVEDGLRMFKKALWIYRRTLGPESVEVGKALFLLSVVLQDLGKDDEAAKKLDEALGILRVVLGDEHEEIAEILYRRAVCLERSRDRAGAVACLKEANAVYAKLGMWYGHAEDVVTMLHRLKGSEKRVC
mmetsp:Transcript_13660/g.26983  ORF Transcript_13660/g.26983 Transcript_13660/m.26983 type:complete len:421 (-) Transcript_13660:54-1316(-)